MVITVLPKDEKGNRKVADIFDNQLCVAPAPSFPLSGWAHPSEQWQMPCPGLLVWAWASALDVSPTASLPQTALPSGAVVWPSIFHPLSSLEWSSDRWRPWRKQDFLRGTRTIGSCPIGSTREAIGSALSLSSFQAWANLPTRFGSLWKRIFLNCWWIPLFVVWQPCNFERKYGNYGFSPQNYDKSAKICFGLGASFKCTVSTPQPIHHIQMLWAWAPGSKPPVSGSKRDWWKGHPNRKDVPTTPCSTTVFWNDICFGWSNEINQVDVLSRRCNYGGDQPQPRAPSRGHWIIEAVQFVKLPDTNWNHLKALKKTDQNHDSTWLFHIYGNEWSTHVNPVLFYIFQPPTASKRSKKSPGCRTTVTSKSSDVWLSPRSSAGQPRGCPNPAWIWCDMLHQCVREEAWKPKWYTSKTNPS